VLRKKNLAEAAEQEKHGWEEDASIASFAETTFGYLNAQ
jgi:hypothetical protein